MKALNSLFHSAGVHNGHASWAAVFIVSLVALTTVSAQPVIVTQPQNQTNLVGSAATFQVTATGAPPLSYQWRSYANLT